MDNIDFEEKEYSEKTKKNEKYLPNAREMIDSKPKLIKSYSEKDYVILPDPHSDPIVVNNIAYMEFDYTKESQLETTSLFDENATKPLDRTLENKETKTTK